ncbi:PilN domain-containing protein [Neobacillus mesonae]|uniref:PilN domain-containing protein n=1 Tax=Neobacillus mesonae TaxID=1193713 RepID=UPI002E238CD2|nr:hypothetical protein [Neobacillus mesonae]
MMLVDINLLPQKEPKKFAFIITLSSLLVILLIVGSFYLWKINAVKDEIASVDRNISMMTKVVEKTNQAAQMNESANSINQLKTAIDWANEYPIQSVQVMRQLTALLPDRGFIQSFGYTEEGAITLTIQFDTAREAAYFLDNLNESKWVQEASLNSLTTVALPEAETAGQATTTVNTNNGTQNNGTVSNTTRDQSNGQAINNTNTTGTADPSQNTNTGSTTNTAVSTTKSTEKKKVNKDILPRYNGQYEIKLNKDVMKEMINKDKKTEEGVTGS